MTDMQTVFHLVDTMTEEEIDQLVEYAEQRRFAQSPLQKPRILGLYEGMGGWISDDFTHELPDEFWGFDKGFDV